uniref:Integrase zinc-binding domain-containing protein n=1 Tax=Phlebotomus papatasi TaxID=29031 RepID=A0A1B0DDA7_PHLPP
MNVLFRSFRCWYFPCHSLHLLTSTVTYGKGVHQVMRVTRILAYILRMGSKNKPTSSLTVVELGRAERKLISYAQDRYLSGVKLAIQEGKLSSIRKFRYLWPLSPFVDNQGLIRVGGRLKNSSESYDVRHPILLPKCDLALIIAKLHIDHQHIGPQMLLATIRQKYWPLGSRDLTRRVCRLCIKCFKHNPTMLSQLMGNLPPDRKKSQHHFITREGGQIPGRHYLITTTVVIT